MPFAWPLAGDHRLLPSALGRCPALPSPPRLCPFPGRCPQGGWPARQPTRAEVTPCERREEGGRLRHGVKVGGDPSFGGSVPTQGTAAGAGWKCPLFPCHCCLLWHPMRSIWDREKGGGGPGLVASPAMGPLPASWGPGTLHDWQPTARSVHTPVAPFAASCSFVTRPTFGKLLPWV